MTANETPHPSVKQNTDPYGIAMPAPRRRLKACVEAWPEAETGAYDPRCCRFPKSCSADIYSNADDSDLEPVSSPPRGVWDCIDQNCYGGPYCEKHPNRRPISTPVEPDLKPLPELVGWALIDRRGKVQMIYPNVDGKPPRTAKTMAIGWTLRQLTWRE